jgi:hypothetical protein
MRKYVICFITAIVLAACDDDFGLNGQASSQLIVEGWIEDGGFPVVMLTRSFPVSTEYQSTDALEDYMLRWAKVTLSNGTDSVVLTGKYDEGYFPPFVYTTSYMKGEAGRQYMLTVDYRDYHATATTTIPSVPRDCVFKVERCSDNDTLCRLKATFSDNLSEKNYYQFFVRVGVATKQYQASYLGAYDDTVLGEVTEVPVYRGHQMDFKEYIPFFTLDDTLSVKFANIDETSFRIWDSYAKMLSLSSNMFLSTSTNMYSNINGGLGYWCGYATITDHIVIRDSVGR